MILTFVLAALLSLGFPVVAHALLLEGRCVGVESGEGSCTKFLDTSGTNLSIVLINTGPPANTGFITADAFNATPGVTFTLNPSPVGLFTLAQGAFTVSPFGSRSALLSTDGNWDGGSSAGGIPVDPVGRTFSFILSRPLSSVEARDLFRSEVLRFQGFTSGDSDKALVTVLPEPGALMLLGTGLVAVGVAFRRRTLAGRDRARSGNA